MCKEILRVVGKRIMYGNIGVTFRAGFILLFLFFFFFGVVKINFFSGSHSISNIHKILQVDQAARN